MTRNRNRRVENEEAVRYEGTLRDTYFHVPGMIRETSVTFPLETNLNTIHAYIYHGTLAWYSWTGPRFV